MPEITAPEKSLRDWDRLNEHDDEPADDNEVDCESCDFCEDCLNICLVREPKEMDATSKFFFNLAAEAARMQRGF